MARSRIVDDTDEDSDEGGERDRTVESSINPK